jgi:uncharacterized protein (DUF3820 family)
MNNNPQVTQSNDYLTIPCPVGKWRGATLGQMPASSLRWFAQNFLPNHRFSDSVAFRQALDRWQEANPTPTNSPKSEGMYRNGDSVYRVQKASAGHLYALTLNIQTGKFDFVRGAMGSLDESMRLTLAQCQEIGRAIGRCVVCGARLTDPDSVERGIGPICASRV